MSEPDTLSDSEWLEISSSHESDNDSLTDSSRDSYHDDLSSMPLSRRSSMSLGSSVDGEVDAWEGFADVATDGMLPDTDPLVAAFAAAEHAGSGPDTDGGVDEEQLVTAALEQSLVGTLSASRSSSLGIPSTVHNSLRDLRLSFPDPITSSRDELNSSYEAVPSSQFHCITDDVSNSPMTASDSAEEDWRHEDLPLKDEIGGPIPGDLGVLAEPGPFPVYWSDGKDFDVVLYGSTLQSREFVRWLTAIFVTGGIPISGCKDKDMSETVPLSVPSSQSLDRPSLAIVSLPSSIPHLLKHTLYLPVVFSANGRTELSQAQENWASFDIRSVQTLRLTKDSENSIFVDGSETRGQVNPQFVCRELEPLLQPHLKKVPRGLEQLKPVHAVTFVALLSLIIGFAVNTAFRSPSLVPTPANIPLSPAYTTPSTFWAMFGTTPNSSVAPVSTAPPVGTISIMPSTLKDFALAVFNPATTTSSVQVSSITTASSFSAAYGSGMSGFSAGESKPARSERAMMSKDVILRPQTALSNPASLKMPPTFTPSVNGKSVKVAPIPVDDSVSVTSLSLKLVDSLSEVVDATLKALESVVPPHMQELMAAFDELIRAIGRQTSSMLADSKSQVQILRERLRSRNERAKERAQQVKEMGEQFLSFAGEQLKARAEIAKTRAHSLKKSIMSANIWCTYAQAHGEWFEKLAEKSGGGSREGERRGAHNGGLFAKLKERRENRKDKGSYTT